ncbi:PulJ/GspJ family protein [Wenyingzhuangia sp. IMCC45533]
MAILKKLKGSTLVEVLVSSVIMSVLLTISTYTILNLSRDNYLFRLSMDINILNETFYFELHGNKEMQSKLQENISMKNFKDSFQLSIEDKNGQPIKRYGGKN